MQVKIDINIFTKVNGKKKKNYQRLTNNLPRGKVSIIYKQLLAHLIRLLTFKMSQIYEITSDCKLC